jgi:glycosyltransferase involved in cell wall biosynthesis
MPGYRKIQGIDRYILNTLLVKTIKGRIDITIDNSRPGVSAIVIVRNEEHCIRDCLDSLKSADEIIVVDGMSTDRTTEICREYTDKIYERPPCGHPEPDREFACSVASYDWALFIDADEKLCPDLTADLQSLIKKDVDGFSIPRWNYMKPNYRAHCYFIDYSIRLARRDSIEHKTSLHTSISAKGRIETLSEDKYYMIHNPPQRTFRKMLAHYLKWGRVHATEMSRTIRYPRPVYLVYAPYIGLKQFFDNYVSRGGYKDGMFGLEWATLWAVYWSYVNVLVGTGREPHGPET